MINLLTGTIKAVLQNSVVIDTGPVGFAVCVIKSINYSIGKKTTILTHMQWNAEQGPTIYGFENEEEKQVFLLIISCSGMGPKIAIAALAQLGPQLFLEAIQTGDDKALSKVSGIGSKKAEQMIVQLKHKVKKLLDSGMQFTASKSLQTWHQVSQVLQSLNYSTLEINHAMDGVKQEVKGKEYTFDQLMRRALSFLAKKT